MRCFLILDNERCQLGSSCITQWTEIFQLPLVTVKKPRVGEGSIRRSERPTGFNGTNKAVHRQGFGSLSAAHFQGITIVDFWRNIKEDNPWWFQEEIKTHLSFSIAYLWQSQILHILQSKQVRAPDGTQKPIPEASSLHYGRDTRESRVQTGNSLAAQWLGIGAFAAVGPGLIPGQGTKTP